MPSILSGSKAATLASFPAVSMFLLTLLGLGYQPPPSVNGAMQHFAAGILLCAIGVELVPEMIKAKGFYESASSAIGFALGMAALIFIGALMDDGDDDDDDDDNKGKHCHPQGDTDGSRRYQNKRLSSEGNMRTSVAEMRSRRRVSRRSQSYTKAALLSAVESAVDQEILATEDVTLLQSVRKSMTTTKPFPTQLLIAIVIDSLTDGFLIGITTAAGPTAGPMMAGSLAIEMGFLGFTLSTALQGQNRANKAFGTIIGPLAIVFGAFIGGLLASEMVKSPVLFQGIIGFGTSALLFMVAEELLLEAHESGGHVWWVDLQLYVGFFASIMGEKLLEAHGV